MSLIKPLSNLKVYIGRAFVLSAYLFDEGYEKRVFPFNVVGAGKVKSLDHFGNINTLPAIQTELIRHSSCFVFGMFSRLHPFEQQEEAIKLRRFMTKFEEFNVAGTVNSFTVLNSFAYEEINIVDSRGTVKPIIAHPACEEYRNKLVAAGTFVEMIGERW